MRTHYENWSAENVFGLILASAVLVVPPAGCGAALWIQQLREVPQWREANVAECNHVADAASARAPEAKASAPIGAGGDPSWLRGLRDDLRGSEPAREAFAICMDRRSNAYASR